MLHITFIVYFVLGIFLNEKNLVSRFMTFIGYGKRPNQSSTGCENDDLEKIDLIDSSITDEEFSDLEMNKTTTTCFDIDVDTLEDTNQEYVLIAKHLHLTYPSNKKKKKKSLDNFSLALKKGEIYGLLGPNGAGKTTFMSIITGSLVQDQGEVVLCGKSIDKAPNNVIGYCPQFDILWPSLTPEEHITFMSMFKGHTH